jgi:hypothetical protein
MEWKNAYLVSYVYIEQSSQMNLKSLFLIRTKKRSWGQDVRKMKIQLEYKNDLRK